MVGSLRIELSRQVLQACVPTMQTHYPKLMVDVTGIEPARSPVQAECSPKLSYTPITYCWRLPLVYGIPGDRRGLNSRFQHLWGG